MRTTFAELGSVYSDLYYECSRSGCSESHAALHAYHGQHGLSRHAMVPAYGMSETSSAIVQSKKFMRNSEQDGQLTIDQTSLTSEIEYVTHDHPNKMTFTEVGTPIPSVWIRIDEHHEVLPEDQVGRLQ